ncbi:error-prone DNA polymerase [Actinomadura harenae]|uniref:Error-prone DNA polymerase n=1 Tax=Actinomadura harenae TaxID=2483351 RepID=A0A3M2M035_9ACTN|nr:error-prone DNA polymerase [Actinomadura harenae]RMI43069.1 DNA polymerase III subunit alpha [Actinomadura harenae]
MSNWFNPPIPWSELEKRLTWNGGGAVAPPSPQQHRPAPSEPAPPRSRAVPEVPWAELHSHSSFSFLDGASDPTRLVEEAARLGVGTMAVTDHDGMYGVVRFSQAAREAGIRTVFGAELSLGIETPRAGETDPAGRHLLVLARDPAGYAKLCSAITTAQLAGGQKGRPIYDLDALAHAHEGRWAVLTGCRKGPVPAALAEGGPEAAERELRRMVEMFGRDNVFVELIDHDQPGDDLRNDALFALAHQVGVQVVASNNVHFAAPGAEARLAETMAAVRSRRALDDMVGWLPASGTAHLRSGREMAARLARFPGVLERTVALGAECAFDFSVVVPKLPDWPLPEGQTEAGHLRELVAEGALARYGTPDNENMPGAYEQIAKELDIIEGLGFPGYFLIVHDIVAFCKQENILCQGRGSAANSAVCYALGITGVDAVRHGLLFERFLSPGRDGPPDIDLDIEHNRREEVIQYVYDKYGRECTAQVANVISYRPRMAVRDAARALGHSPGQQDAWSRGIDPRDPVGSETEVPGPVQELAHQMLELPRHLGIHSGGMVIADRPVGEVCPIEWASKEKRSVLQWDKDDCAAAGLVKFDLLGLGMLAALHDCFDLVRAHYGESYDLQSVPPEDSDVYDMLCDADTVGVFQVESRAQMSALPRLRPRRFYDLVVQVSLIRPGPIQGGSVHPYLRRRKGLEAPACPHPLMEGALARTLGVPLFQEQMMELAIACAGFTPAEADQLRQAMGAKRAPERVERLRERLMHGMAERGIPEDVAKDVYQKILGFTGYGFPESHAQSFAHLVYASAYLKRHHPAAFTAAIIRNQPMGFYSSNSLLADAKRHGITVRGVDVNASDLHTTLEEPVAPTRAHEHAPKAPQPAIRVGLASVRDLGTATAEAIAAGRPYRDMEDLARRVTLSAAALEALATAGAFGCFGLSRRQALWAAGALAGNSENALEGVTPGTVAPPLPAMTPVEETLADLWATGIAHTHPMTHVREALDDLGALSSENLGEQPGDTNVVVAGLVTHRQRPPTAGGMVFMTLEDETGVINVVCPPPVFARYRSLAVDSQALLVHGRLERVDGVTHVRATRLRRLPVPGRVRSRDFH